MLEFRRTARCKRFLAKCLPKIIAARYFESQYFRPRSTFDLQHSSHIVCKLSFGRRTSSHSAFSIDTFPDFRCASVNPISPLFAETLALDGCGHRFSAIAKNQLAGCDDGTVARLTRFVRFQFDLLLSERHPGCAFMSADFATE